MKCKCQWCEIEAEHRVLAIHINKDELPNCEYTFAVCKVCNKPVLMFREDMDDGKGFEGDSYGVLWPKDV